MAITQERLKQLLHYDPDIGVFFRKMRPTRRQPFFRLIPCGFVDSKGYTRIGVERRTYSAHRLAWPYMTGKWPSEQIDHVDLDKANNRWVNLREADNSQNQANTPARKNNPVGLKGAHRAANGRWSSRIGVRGERYFLGLFATPEEAHAAYREAATRLNPEFGRAA